jgi:preprotein translocase subunit SecF
MSRVGSMGARLYRGEVSYDFVGRRNRWYVISAVVLLLSLASLLTRQLTLGIEFKGGAEFQVNNAPTATQASVLDVVNNTIGGEVTVQTVGTNSVRAQTEKLTSNQLETIQTDLAKRFNIPRADVSTQFIGPSWGSDISHKALRALIIFIVLVMIFLSLYFEWKMAVAAMIALIHDLLITVGIYSLVGFEVTPATVIGFLTILGYSLYDTVVVFDKVRENTSGLLGGSRMTYSQAANLAVNQTLVRSINTSIIALLPIGAILFAGAALLGQGPLKDLALALFIGVATGTYSSIFIATPLLAQLKEREPGFQALARRVSARAGGSARGTRRDRPQVEAVDESTSAEEIEAVDEPQPAATGARTSGGAARASGARRPPQRSQPKRGNKNRSKKRR